MRGSAPPRWCWPATRICRELTPQFANTLLPIYSTAIVTAPMRDRLAEAIRFPGAVSDEATPAGHHYRVVDGRLMWSGQSATWLGNPRRRGEALARQIGRTYPALRGIKAEHAWIGVAGQTVHGMPQIGEITPGLWLLGGFGGHGIAATAMAGEMVARAIVDSDRAWQMFSPFPLIWAGGVAGRAAQQVSECWRRGRETVEQSLARRRERQAASKRRRPSGLLVAP